MKLANPSRSSYWLIQLMGAWSLLALLFIAPCGANEHWAFRLPAVPTLPTVRNPTWAQHHADRFVLEQLDRQGHEPSTTASRSTLIRRLSLDITGLPPTLDEFKLRLQDTSPDAHERHADHLLASPHFGERWALWWLDAVRYADSNGYEVDRPRSVWPYRDWLISAFNNGLPFDQFAIEQIAGDMLPEATLEQRIATGFHRHTYLNEEGGHDWEQFRWEAIVDRVHTTATIFLGLSFSCAQCHDHKYDPLTQEEYWRFFAFFNNVDEPFLEVPTGPITDRRKTLLSQIATLEKTRQDIFPHKSPRPAGRQENDWRQHSIDLAFHTWCRHQAAAAVKWRVLEPLHYTSKMNATLSPLEDHSLLATGDRPEIDTYHVTYRLPTGPLHGLLLEALPHPALPKRGPGRGSVLGDGAFALSEFKATLPSQTNQQSPQPMQLTFLRPSATYQQKNRTIELSIDGDKLTNWHIQGGEGRAQWALFPTATAIPINRPTTLSITYLMNFVHQQTLGRFRLSITQDPKPLRLPSHPPQIDSLLATGWQNLSLPQRTRLRDYFLSVTPELAELNKQIQELRAALPEPPTTLVVTERPTSRITFLHTRGEFHRRESRVTADVPEMLHALPRNSPRNRLAMAKWIASRDNPLTGRVILNQIWQEVFGRGLVVTPEDFGTQGTPPTHPKLLDWLATEFLHRDWDLKAMIQQIVHSSTYRQSSRISAAAASWDPLNQWLARGPRFRVHAEVIRDLALTSSGLLTRRIGGPSFFPPRPDLGKMIAYANASWSVSKGAERYRRGLYIHRKRTAPHPGLASLDAPPRNTCKVRRRRSNTPLQALALLNDQTMLESAQAIAHLITANNADTEVERAQYAFRLCLSREPDAREVEGIVQYYHRQFQRLSAGTLDAAAIAGSEESKSDASLSSLAAWTATARVLLNLDETLTKE
ncbi:MAG: hypothetical protein CMJ75_09520 [Planctomycetaceae bacterium]|nr:hypothetical protein [Planctomycetaceae bacterium]